MSNIQFGSGFTLRTYSWLVWKSSFLNKNGVCQFDDDGIIYTIWFYDGPEVHICNIWKGIVPDTVSLNYSQSQNDSDKSDFETNFKSKANAAIQPKASDGKPNFIPNLFPTTTLVCVAGAGDDPVNGRGNGLLFQSSTIDLIAIDHTYEWQFTDPVYLTGGIIVYNGGMLGSGAASGDTVDYYLHATPTVVTSTPGTGNCNLAGPGNVLIVPNQSMTGSNTVNLSTAIPVTNISGTGHWDWSDTGNGVGSGSITANYSNTGGFDLYTIDIKLARLVVTVSMLGTNSVNLMVPALTPKKVLPQWTHRVTVHNSGGSHQLNVGWTLILSRSKTT